MQNRFDWPRLVRERNVAFLLGAVMLLARTNALAQASAPAPSSGQSEYVGAETCTTCHEDQKRFNRTIMGKVFAQPRTADEKLGCEACHGPGRAHEEAGGGKDTSPLRFAKDANETAERKNHACLTCHRKGENYPLTKRNRTTYR